MWGEKKLINNLKGVALIDQMIINERGCLKCLM